MILRYGNGKDKDSVVLQILRKREFEMDGQMSGLWGVEYHGGGDSGDRKEGRGAVCSRAGGES